MPGIVAIGDSVTNACSADLALGGVPARSWAQVVADTLGQPLTIHAKPGAPTSIIRRDVLPHVTGSFDLALIYAGVNNVKSWRWWRADNFADDLTAMILRASDVAPRVFVMSFPASLGQLPALWPYGPRLGWRISEANRIVRSVAAAHDARVLAAPPLRSPDEMWADGLHPTSLGHLAMADSAVSAIAPGHPLPSTFQQIGPVDPSYRVWRRKETRRLALRLPPRSFAGWLIAR